MPERLPGLPLLNIVALWRRVARQELVYSLVILLSTATRGGMVQSTSNATCDDPDRRWRVLGTRTADVCEIARDLMGTCHVFSLPKLDKRDNSWYTASDFSKDALNCTCTTVMYNLLSVCAGCQKWDWEDALGKDLWLSKSKYQSTCVRHSSEGTGPLADVGDKRDNEWKWNNTPPNWSQELNVEVFNLSIALAVAQNNSTPEPNESTASTSSTSTNAISPSNTAETTPTASTKSANSSPNIGAIVGGIIGALVFLSAIVGLGFWLYRRKRRARDVAPSAEFLKPEYYATPPLLSAGLDRGALDYRDDIEEEMEPANNTRHSWAVGLVTNRTREEQDDDGDMLPPFTQGTYIGPSPHEKGNPARRETGDSDITMRTNNTTTNLLSSSPARRSGPSGYFS